VDSSPPNVDELLRARLPQHLEWQPTPLRHAAVLGPIVARDGVDHLLFLVRPDGSRQHAGQIAFPGGMRAGNEAVVATALREAEEEIGAAANAFTVLGGLGTRESSSGILVHGVVARLAAVELRPDPREVVRLLHVPLAELRDDRRWQERPPPGGATGRQPRTSPHFVFGDELLWGLTARFVRDLMALLRDA
jgi:8-oxo-dGTP pyrophosphatase MutT (NUDIX family)